MCNMKIVITVLLMLVSFTIIADENLIIGKWKSDEAKTIELISASNELSSERKQAILKNIKFGRLVLEINQNQIISYYDGEKSILEYTVLESHPGSLTIKVYEDYLKKNVRKVIRVNDGYLLMPSSISPPIVEAFVKLQ